jgi:hypothetical protein
VSGSSLQPTRSEEAQVITNQFSAEYGRAQEVALICVCGAGRISFMATAFIIFATKA